MHLKFSIDSAIAGNDLRRAAALARQVRAEGLVLPARSTEQDLTGLSGTGRREVRHVLASAQVQLVAVRHAVGHEGLSPRGDLDAAVETIAAILRAAAELGRAMLCVDLGLLPPAALTEVAAPPRPTPEQAGLILLPDPAPPGPTPAIPRRDPVFESSVNAVLREIGRQADRCGVVVAFSSSLASMASIQQAIAAVACPWFGIDLDPTAMLADDEDRDALLSRIGPLIRHVKLKDAVRGAGNRVRAVPVGDGQVDWRRMLRDLDAAGYHGFLTVETGDLPHSGPPAVVAALERVRAWSTG